MDEPSEKKGRQFGFFGGSRTGSPKEEASPQPDKPATGNFWSRRSNKAGKSELGD